MFEIDKTDIVETRIDKIVDGKDIEAQMPRISISPLPIKGPIIFQDEDDGENGEDEIMA